MRTLRRYLASAGTAAGDSATRAMLDALGRTALIARPVSPHYDAAVSAAATHLQKSITTAPAAANVSR